jgi:two-component system KDP operon response regulator KdpE
VRHASHQADEPVFRTGDLTIDLSHRLVMAAGHAVDLMPVEYGLLKVLIAHAGKVLTYRQLLAQVWGPGYQDRHLLQVNISNLRRKLESDPTRPRYIVTEPGVGYRLIET